MPTTRPPRDRVGISTISFRFRPFEEALSIIAGLGCTRTELGAIPDVVDHVPVPFTGDPARYVDLLAAHGLTSVAVNSDVGNVNDPALTRESLSAVATPLIGLAAATGGALIVPCGRQTWQDYVGEASDLEVVAANLTFLSQLCVDQGVRLLVEVLHHRRWIHTVERANRLLDLVDASVFGLLFDTSHVVASDEDVVAWAAEAADRIEEVHFRDAVPGNLNLGLGRGAVDFAGVVNTLEARGYIGDYVLELETHDVAESEREADALRSYTMTLDLLENPR